MRRAVSWSRPRYSPLGLPRRPGHGHGPTLVGTGLSAELSPAGPCETDFTGEVTCVLKARNVSPTAGPLKATPGQTLSVAGPLSSPPAHPCWPAVRNHAYACSQAAHDQLRHHCCLSFSRTVVSDSVTPMDCTRQPPLSVGFSRQAYWVGLPFPSGALQGIGPASHHLSCAGWRVLHLQHQLGSLWPPKGPIIGQVSVIPDSAPWSTDLSRTDRGC